jgi:hypothetical protein
MNDIVLLIVGGIIKHFRFVLLLTLLIVALVVVAKLTNPSSSHPEQRPVDTLEPSSPSLSQEDVLVAGVAERFGVSREKARDIIKVLSEKKRVLSPAIRPPQFSIVSTVGLASSPETAWVAAGAIHGMTHLPFKRPKLLESTKQGE